MEAVVPWARMRSHVALLIPAYKAAAFLPRLLAEARQQTRPFDEVIVVDDASTEETPAVLAAAEAEGVRTGRLSENQGSAVVRNRLLELATADVVHFHDGDDGFLSPALVETLLPHVEATTASFCDWQGVDADGAETAYTYQEVGADTDWTRFFIHRHLHLNATLYPRDFLREAGGFDHALRMQQDLMLNLEMAAAGLKFAHVPKVLAGHWRRAFAKLDERYHVELAEKFHYHLRQAALCGGLEDAEAALAWPEVQGVTLPPAGGRAERLVAKVGGPKAGLRYLAWRQGGRA